MLSLCKQRGNVLIVFSIGYLIYINYKTITMAHVYSLTNPINNQIYYVGFTIKGIEERLAGHLYTNHLETTKMLTALGYTPIISVLEEGELVTKHTETQWIKKLYADGCKLENIDGLINYQNRKDTNELSDDEIGYLSLLPENEGYKVIINRILKELPLNPTIPLVLRIKNYCETILTINNQ